MLPAHLGHNVCSHVILGLFSWRRLIAQLRSSAHYQNQCQRNAETDASINIHQNMIVTSVAKQTNKYLKNASSPVTGSIPALSCARLQSQDQSNVTQLGM